MKKREIVFDIETDTLLPFLTKISVLCWADADDPDNVHTIMNYSQMVQFFSQDDVLFIGHNIVDFDLPAVRKVLKLAVKFVGADTLVLSRYLEPHLKSHGLEKWGEMLGVAKPVIASFSQVTENEIVNRCKADVKINVKLWNRLKTKLERLYGVDQWYDLNEYLWKKYESMSFSPVTYIDYDEVDTLHNKIHREYLDISDRVRKVIPDKVTFTEREKPKKMYLKDGKTFSARGRDWINFLNSMRLPKEHPGPVRVIKSVTPGNPGSHAQIKEWLFSLGWVPRTFKSVVNKSGPTEVPQLKGPDGEICPSVEDLAAQHPVISDIPEMFMLQHRASFIEGFLGINERQEHLGTTNTLRFKHKKPFCNIPGVDRPKGREIRKLIKALDDDHVVIGADMVSLEDTTKRHYIKPLDPVYVAEMEKPGYDPHLDIAKQRGLVQASEIKAYQAGNGPVSRMDSIRKSHKVVNYSAVYGIGARALAKSANCSLVEAKQMLDTYWKRNWAVKKAMETIETKMIGRHEWAKNPVSGFWYVLRHPKDTFSTINQSTGVYCFDTFVFSLMNKGIQPSLQFHDEVVIMCHKDKVQETLKIMQDCMKETNTKVNLNVELKLDAQVGNNYAEVH